MRKLSLIVSVQSLLAPQVRVQILTLSVQIRISSVQTLISARPAGASTDTKLKCTDTNPKSGADTNLKSGQVLAELPRLLLSS